MGHIGTGLHKSVGTSSTLRRPIRGSPHRDLIFQTLASPEADATAIGERTVAGGWGLPISAFPGLLSSALTVTLPDALLANN